MRCRLPRPSTPRLPPLLVAALVLAHAVRSALADDIDWDWRPNPKCAENDYDFCFPGYADPVTGAPPQCNSPITKAPPGGCPEGWVSSWVNWPKCRKMGCFTVEDVDKAGGIHKMGLDCNAWAEMLRWLGPWTLYGACPKFHHTLACCDTTVAGYPGCMRTYDCVGKSPSSPPPPKIDNCTLGSIVKKGSPCSTDAVSRLSGQIAAEMGKLGVKLVSLSSDQKKHIDCLYKEGCSGRMNPDALSSLVKVAKKKKKRITLKSMWRSAAQQYLLYRFHATGKCNQRYVVDRPGNSAHEGGAAIDVKRETVSTWAFALMTEHWKWPLPSSDPVHFAYQSTSKAHSKYSLIAFQRLWNRHNPESRIAEDGHYGKETEAALSKTPCKGW